MASRRELAERAADAYAVYRTYFGIPEDPEAYARFFAPPVCNKAEGRMRVLLETASRDGVRLVEGTRVWGMVDKRYVYGIDRWIPKAPRKALLTVIIKNPFHETDDAVFDRLGVTNALVVYEKAPLPEVFLGGMLRRHIYAIRPAVENDTKRTLLAFWQKHTALR